MKPVQYRITKTVIPTYPQPQPEELPMFAENRVHQRTSGRPYPNKVVLSVDRSCKENKEYTLITLENDYVKIEILPEIGGRIYSALDKTTGYDYFYKQHVIKPALIGVLGSWISGGVEFNWPFHHRASGFMPCDYKVEKLPNGAAVCFLGEHDPIDRMKSLVQIILRPDATFLETKVRLYNRTAGKRSFLWWENAAVPVNEQYQIFFPQDVSYVNFHYLKSRTTYPVAGNGVYNGIPMQQERDISWHKNTREATSYFAAASDYDFFGGYDHGKQCGVVHIGNHHLSPGKKMFTWAYGQLAKSWENALTDTDGQYAELMAGSYSDNQPDFAWLDPYETKEFSQYWYPIFKIGAPTFANLNAAFRLDRAAGTFTLQTTRSFQNAEIKIFNEDGVYFTKTCSLTPNTVFSAKLPKLPKLVTVQITANGAVLAAYTEQNFNRLNMPPVIQDIPAAAGMTDPDELYLAGVHVAQYRDPATEPDAYWLRALERKPNHAPSLLALAEYELERFNLTAAEHYATRALAALTLYNAHPQSGMVYYLLGRIFEEQKNFKAAYNNYYKAYWAADCVAKAMTRIAVLDLKNNDPAAAAEHARCALEHGGKNSLALGCLLLSLQKQGRAKQAADLAGQHLAADPLDHFIRLIAGADDFYAPLAANPVQTCLDLAFDLLDLGQTELALQLLSGLGQKRPDCRQKPLYYTLGYLQTLLGQNAAASYQKAGQTPLGLCYPHRFGEIAVLQNAPKTDETAKMLLGCLYYNRRHYQTAATLWQQSQSSLAARRNLAVAYFSHLNRPDEALKMMQTLVLENPTDPELLYETVVLMDKLSAPPAQKIKLLRAAPALQRDDLLTELAKAYNQALQPEKALAVLMGHPFVPCEGGEHAVADQYLFAHLTLGRSLLAAGKPQQALQAFQTGQRLPQSLGAGLWNRCKLVPLRFFEAMTLKQLEKAEPANLIFKDIAEIEVEYFSNMHLKELPYFKALAMQQLGQRTKAQQTLTAALREWQKFGEVQDNGFFNTTPFFIPFIESPKKLRRAQYCYLLALCNSFMKEPNTARQLLQESLAKNSENLLALSFLKFGFPG